MILNYRHQSSGHCESGVTSNLLDYYGLNISEPMVFGIGAGLYFSYFPFVKIFDSPMIAFRVLPNRIFNKATRELGVKATIHKRFSDPRESMALLDRNLEQGIPTGLQIGVYHLAYFPVEYRMHYNFHNIIIFGKEGNIYHVGEPIREETQVLTYDDLLKVRYAKGPFSPKGKMYHISEVPDKPDLHVAVMHGIRKTVQGMIKDQFPYTGTKGMKMLARHILKWPEKLSEKKARYYVLQLVRNIEEVGTSGAAFRFMYGAFLKEAGELLKIDELTGAGHDMGITANKWRELSHEGVRVFRNPEYHPGDFRILSEILQSCATREEVLFRKLDQVARKSI